MEIGIEMLVSLTQTLSLQILVLIHGLFHLCVLQTANNITQLNTVSYTVEQVSWVESTKVQRHSNSSSWIMVPNNSRQQDCLLSQRLLAYTSTLVKPGARIPHLEPSQCYENMAVFIIFPKLETRFNTHYQNAYANTPSETRFSSCCVYHWTLSRVRVARKALSLRSCIAQFDPWSRDHVGRVPSRRSIGDINVFQKWLCVYHLYRNVFLAQRRFRSHFFRRFRKAFLTP